MISAKQQSHTEEYGIVHGSSNHIRKNTKEYGVEVAEYYYRRNSSFKDDAQVIVQVASMSAFRPFFFQNGSFARVLKSQTHTHTDRSLYPCA